MRSMQSLKIEGDVIDMAGVCPRCSGTGWDVSPDGGNGAAKPCECRRATLTPEQLAEALRECGMVDDEIRSAWSPWDDKATVKKPVVVAKWVDMIRTGRPKNCALVLMGKPGRGKSKAAAMGMARYLRHGGLGARWVVMGEWLDAVMAERRSYGNDSPAERQARGARFLVADELGLESESGSEASRANRQAAADALIQWRMRRELPTIYTTNVTDLASLGDARSSSRFAGKALVVEMEGEDYRDR